MLAFSADVIRKIWITLVRTHVTRVFHLTCFTFILSLARTAQAESVSVNLTVPTQRPLETLSFLASDSINLGNGSVLTQPPGVAVANMGTGVVNLGHDVRLASLLAGGNVQTGDRVILDGSLTAVGSVTPRLPQVAGGTSYPPALSSSALALALWAPEGTGSVVVQHDQVGSASPGGYSKLEVKDRGRLNLTPGVYATDNLIVGWSSKLSVNTSTGPLVLVVRQGATFNGAIQESGGSGRVLIVYTGTNPLRI